jgi:hypothetical protein
MKNEPLVPRGLVMGPAHCAFDDCTQDLTKLKGGVLCVHHELFGISSNVGRPRMRNTRNIRLTDQTVEIEMRIYSREQISEREMTVDSQAGEAGHSVGEYDIIGSCVHNR